MDEQRIDELKRPGKILRLFLLVGMTCIFIALFFPSRSGSGKIRVAIARKEIHAVKLAVEAFQSQYGKLPMTEAVMKAANPDFTFGTYETVGEQRTEVLSNSKRRYQANNSGVVVILMNEVHPKFNPNYTNNPQKKVFLNPRDNPVDGGAGVGPSRVFLDPWGNPYIISVDVNEDGWVEDAFYSLAAVSRAKGSGVDGLNGLVSKSGMGTNDYALHGTVMIWSFGPDGKADPNIGANEGVNRDNILSWK